MNHEPNSSQSVSTDEAAAVPSGGRTRPGGGEVHRTTSIRRRLLSVLALPIVAVAVIAGLQVRAADEAADSARTEAEIALAAGGPGSLITALLDERNISALELIGMTVATDLRVSSSADARPLTDARLGELRTYLGEASPAVRAVYQEVLDEVADTLTSVRLMVDSHTGERTPANLMAHDVYDRYTRLLASFHAANDRAILEISDADLRNRARSIVDQSRFSDLTSQLARSVAMAQLQGDVDQSDMLAANETSVRRQEAGERAVAALSGDPAVAEVVESYLKRPEWQQLDGLIVEFVTNGRADLVQVVALAGTDAEPNAATAWETTRASLQERTDELVSSSAAGRRRALWVFGASVVLAVALAVWAARSISRPLLDLADEAERMSSHRLPDALAGVLETELGHDIVEPALPALGRSRLAEVDAVVVALNSVQDRALALAVEQAAMRHHASDSLVNLGRRVQGLVGRQLEHLSELEQTESDPDALAALFTLDHLATRVRRNAESLVVLAGSTRVNQRMSVTAPVEVIDVVRGAIAEVESFERVDLEIINEADVLGNVSSDLSHILAELIENGLAFSPPTSGVSVGGFALPNGYRLTVTDAGLGMNDEALARANLRLAGEESFTVAPSKYLGHYVAGHLARRHGIDVVLRTNHAGGVTAVISVPAGLLADPGATESDVSQEPTEEEAATSAGLADVLDASRSLREALTVPRDDDGRVERAVS